MIGSTTEHCILSDDLLARCRKRAPEYDRDNRFFTEDFDELRQAGYLLMAVPEELGGLGLNLAEVGRAQRRPAHHAPAPALASHMHLYCTGHAEAGNDIPVLLSTTKAEPVEGGYRFTGHKAFGSLSPVWTYLGIHGMDTSDPQAPKIVHAFMPRGTPGSSTKETWDVLGMRATRSDDTLLEGAFVPDQYIARVVPAGAAGIDMFVLGIFAWGLLGFANIYYGLAQRALDLTIDSVKKKSVLALSRSMAYHAEVQHSIAEMVLESVGNAWCHNRLPLRHPDTQTLCR